MIKSLPSSANSNLSFSNTLNTAHTLLTFSMNKHDVHTSHLVAANVARFVELFPNCFNELRDPNIGVGIDLSTEYQAALELRRKKHD